MPVGRILMISVVILVLVAAVWVLFFRSAADSEPVREPAQATRIPMAEALERLKKGEKAILLDVRTPEEHAERNIPGSLLLPLADDDVFVPLASKLIPDKNATIFVYCRSGRRSQIAAEALARNGYRNVFNIGGVIDIPSAGD